MKVVLVMQRAAVSCEMGGAWVWEQAEHRDDISMSDAKQPPCSQAAGDQIHVAKSFREF